MRADCRRRRGGTGVSSRVHRSRPQRSWFKGNLHTHTLNSDGDSTPDDVVRWYREHGYNFVTLTDHNYLTSVDGLNALHGADDQFLVMKGEEVTDRFQTKPVHLNGFAPTAFISRRAAARCSTWRSG
jgi:predicted metal-dependent phosphoesterase TrpH